MIKCLLNLLNLLFIINLSNISQINADPFTNTTYILNSSKPISNTITSLATSHTHTDLISLTSTSSTMIEPNNTNNSINNHKKHQTMMDYKSTKFITIVSVSGLIFLSSVIVITISLCNPKKPKHKIYKVPSTQNLQSFDNPLFDYRANENRIISGYKIETPTTTLYDESYASYNEETY